MEDVEKEIFQYLNPSGQRLYTSSHKSVSSLRDNMYWKSQYKSRFPYDTSE